MEIHVINLESRPANVLRYFDSATKSTLMQWKFAATGQKFIGEIEITYKLQ